MKRRHKINFSKLLGFALIADHLSATVNLRDDTVGARIGAKVGEKPTTPSDLLRKLGTPENEVGHGQVG
jgi:hypothetical protein